MVFSPEKKQKPDGDIELIAYVHLLHSKRFFITCITKPCMVILSGSISGSI
jgi:hypothetical protein